VGRQYLSSGQYSATAARASRGGVGYRFGWSVLARPATADGFRREEVGNLTRSLKVFLLFVLVIEQQAQGRRLRYLLALPAPPPMISLDLGTLLSRRRHGGRVCLDSATDMVSLAQHMVGKISSLRR
jgi:hypothetical protein